MLTVEEITSRCAPPYREISVGFTDKGEEEIYFSDQAEIRYVEYPWITCFEVEGIELKK